MRLACKYCKKVFSSGAALNFHTKKLHQKDLSESAPSPSSGPQSKKSNAKTPLCPMIKFGRIKDVPDPLAGPFKAFAFCKSDLVDATKTTKKSTFVEPSSSTGKSRINVENKEDEVGDDDDEDIVEILQDRQPQPSSSAAAFNFETPATSSQTSQKKRKGKKGGEIKRRRLSEEYSSNSDSSPSKEIAERNRSGYQSQSIPIAVGSVAKQPILSRSSLSSTDGEDDASVAGSSASVSTTNSRRGRKPSGRRATRINGKIQPCPICGLTEFRNDNHYANHVEIHEGKRPFLCPQCGRGYKTDIELLEHNSVRHLKEPAFECAKCGNSYKIRRAFQNHKCS